jgi:hypothetical protein
VITSTVVAAFVTLSRELFPPGRSMSHLARAGKQGGRRVGKQTRTTSSMVTRHTSPSLTPPSGDTE